MGTSKIPMPLNALRSFEAAARLGSFKAAAEELAVTPSAISLQVRRLEEILGRRLFSRGHRSITLSKAGAALAPTLSRLFAQMEQALTAAIGPERSLLRISAVPSFANQWLAPRLGRFLARFPQYQVQVAGEDQLESFDRDDADIGLRYGAGDYPELHKQLIARAVAFPVCSPAFAKEHEQELITPEGLLGLPLLEDDLARSNPGLPSWRAWFQAVGIADPALTSASHFGSHHMTLMSAVSGHGVALAVAPLADSDLSQGRLVRLFDVAIPSAFSFWLVCRPDRANEAKIAAFRSWVADESLAEAAALEVPGPVPASLPA